jgi:transposase
LLDKYDRGHTRSHIFGKRRMRWLKAIKLEGNDHLVQINNHINNIEFLNNEINEIDKKISSQAAAVKKQDVKILTSMTSIDYFSAMMIMSEIGDISRFGNPNKLVSWYAGLCPTLHQSGNSIY